jgi:hypothetical protein
MKVVINMCYGGFGISLQAARWMAAKGHELAQTEVKEFDQQDEWIKEFVATGTWPKACPKKQIIWLEIDAKCFKGKRWYGGFRCERTDPLLIQAVKKLGKKANGEHAELKIVTIPDGTDFTIEEYDGSEHIAQAHQTWR